MRRSIYLVALVAGLVATHALAQTETVRELDKVFPLASDGKVVIDTYKGSVHVSTWDKSEVRVHVRIEADGAGRRDEENVGLTEIRMDGSAREVRLETDYRKIHSRGSFLEFSDSDGNMPLVHYTVTMPATADLRIKDYKSESSIRGLSARFDFETYKGTLDVEDLRGDVDLETYKGDLDVGFGELRGDCRAETYKGSIRLRIPKGAGFNLDAELGRRADLLSDFSLKGVQEERDRHDQEYRGAVNGGGPEIHLESYKGTYRLVAK